ncbi:MAG TPA: TetR family transcriptional regulator [Actinomycetes bacterium]|nr:TetR family transcriptional regulator [Actinomycetes bacterium]
MMARTGRRPGDSGTRDAILDAARRAFAERGYDAATIRAVAEAAGVDPALVHHYFGSKEQLFVTTMELPVDPTELVARLLAGDREHIGERIAATFVSVWDQTANQHPFIALIRSAVSSEKAATMLREFLAHALFRRITDQLGMPDGHLRASLVASQLMGLAIARYIIRIEPLASAPPPVVVAAIGPTLQRYVTGDLGPAAGDHPPAGRAQTGS